MASRPSASRPCFFPLPVRRSPSGARAGLVVVGLHVGGARSTHTTPQVRRQIAGTRKAARLSRRATRPREIEQSELTCRPTAARPSNQQIDLLRRRGPNPRSCVRLRRRGGVTTRGARLLGRLVSAEWIVPLRHWRAAALWYGCLRLCCSPPWWSVCSCSARAAGAIGLAFGLAHRAPRVVSRAVVLLAGAVDAALAEGEGRGALRALHLLLPPRLLGSPAGVHGLRLAAHLDRGGAVQLPL